MILKTKTGIPFTILQVTNSMIDYKLRNGSIQSSMRATYEEAVKYLQQGGILKGPRDIRINIRDDRPAYVWAVLHHLEYC